MEHSVIFVLLTRLRGAVALIGYDCGGKAANITQISLLDIGQCELPEAEPAKESKYIQLLQISDYNTAHVIQCKVEVDRTIYYCGMHSHNSVVHNGRREYILEVNREACQQMHATGILALSSNIQVTELKVNQSQSRSATLAGSIAIDGTCHGTQYSDAFGTWNNVVVQANLKIMLQTYQASIRTSSNQLTLRSGVRCALAEGHCMDADGGNTYWSPSPTDSCKSDQYAVLYEGWASKLYPKEHGVGPTIYTVTTKETTFALLRTTDFPLCGYTIIRTEHPKLFIVEAVNGEEDVAGGQYGHLRLRKLQIRLRGAAHKNADGPALPRLGETEVQPGGTDTQERPGPRFERP